LNYRCFDDAPAVICAVKGPTHVCSYTNAWFHRLFGPAEIVGQSIAEALPELFPRSEVGLLDRVYASGQALSAREVAVARPSSMFLDLTYQPHRDESGAIDGILIFGFDVTEQVELRRSAESARRQAEADHEFLAAVLDTVDEAIVACDSNSVLTLLNKKTTELHGTTFAPQHASEWAKHSSMYRADGLTPLPPDEVPLLRAARGEQMKDVEVVIVREGSSDRRTVLVSGQPVRSLDGAILGAVAVMRDITEERRMQKDLRTAELTSALGHLASRMAHEFNNVLMGIQTMLTVIGRTAKEDSAVKAIAHVEQAIARGKLVTSEVLRMSRAGRPALQPLNVASFIEGCSQELRSQLGSSVVASFDPIAEQLWISGDPSQLQQVLINLASNANDAMAEGGRISIAARSSEDESSVIFEVSDDGAGIPEEVLPTIFEPMVTTRREKGHGLGLAIVRQTVRGHGGEIDVTSTIGRGATFTIRLPRTQPVIPATPAATPREAWRGRVLLVEDDDIVASGLAMHLDGSGSIVSRASTGHAALDALRVFGPDLMILDIGLPDVSGEVVFEQVKVLRPDLPIIIATAHGDAATFAAFLERQSVAFLSKPFDMKALDAVIERVTNPVSPESATSDRSIT